MIDKRVAIHASIADNLETLFVRIWLRSTFQICKVDFFLPLSWDFEHLHFIITNSGGLVSLESKSKDTQSIVNINFRDTKRLSFSHVADKESRSIENGFVE